MDEKYPQLEALSYEWNASRLNDENYPNKTYIIVKNIAGHSLKSIKIGYNLFDFLRHLRHPEDDIWIWTDAVCIDQRNLEESANGVRLMGHIYSCAEKVLAWLPAESPKLCVDSLISLRAGTRAMTLDLRHLRLYATAEEQVLDAGCLKMTYWTRNWIIQEIILARKEVLVLGDLGIPVQDLEDIFAKLEVAHTCDPVYGRTSAAVALWPVAQLATHKRHRRLGEEYPRMLCDLPPIYARNHGLDPLDHVYALYNLIGEHREHLTVDYKLSAPDWFFKVLKFMDHHEPSSKYTVMQCALLLLKMIHPSDFFSLPLSPTGLATQITASAFDRGGLVEECAHSSVLRKRVKSLHPGIQWILEENESCFSVIKKTSDKAEHVSTRVLSYFEVRGI